jgi:hypothetical protein
VDERGAQHRIDSYAFGKVDAWRSFETLGTSLQDALPVGRIERIYTHWSAHDYASVFPAYHFCVATLSDGAIVVANTHDVRHNMRDVSKAPDTPYAAHTRGRNSFALGISIMGMADARPDDFGPYPLTSELVNALCLVGARLAQRYGVAIDADHVMSHAEAALLDGYFGTAPEERWDIARLHPDARPLRPDDALESGERLRSMMQSWPAA